jgi:hypothetical protein
VPAVEVKFTDLRPAALPDFPHKLLIATHVLLIEVGHVPARFAEGIKDMARLTRRSGRSVFPGLGIEYLLSFLAHTHHRIIAGKVFQILSAGLFGNSLSGASMNPARSLGPALFAGGSTLAVVWIYMLGPAIGVLLGAFFFEAIRGSQEHAKDVVDELSTKKEEFVQPKLPVKSV